MIVGPDEDVTYVEGLDFHERGATGVAHHDARRQPAREYPAEDTIVHAHHYDTTIRKPVEAASDRLPRETDGIALALTSVPAAVTFGYVCYYLIGLKAFRVRRTSGG